MKIVRLADGSALSIVAEDQQASVLVTRLAHVMQLPFESRFRPQIQILVDKGPARWNNLFRWPDALPAETEDITKCVLKLPENRDILALQLIRLSLLIGLNAQFGGGFLIHGALAEREGRGVILAASGGVGKTTAMRRLPAPWRPLCDDLSLIVRDRQGMYWAHPWPTWSTFMFGGSGGSWDVQYAVPLNGIFFLKQTEEEQVDSIGAGQAVCLLVEAAEQAVWAIPNTVEEDKIRHFRQQRFENICAVAQTLPCYLLQLSLAGTFWKKIEKVLDENT